MPLWGNFVQPVNVTANTTHETASGGGVINTNGLVNGKKGSNTVPAGPNGSFGNTSPGSMAGIDLMLFQNTSIGTFNYGKAIGVFGVTANQMGNNTVNRAPDQPQHAGWVVRRAGSGPIISVYYTGTANNYSNGDVVSFPTLEGSSSGGNNVATAVISTNASGGALSFTVTYGGHGFTSVSNNAGTVANSTGGTSTGTGATFFGMAGGRAGRSHNETLVAMGSMTLTANSVQNSIYPTQS